jgi:hypothetical protein
MTEFPVLRIHFEVVIILCVCVFVCKINMPTGNPCPSAWLLHTHAENRHCGLSMTAVFEDAAVLDRRELRVLAKVLLYAWSFSWARRVIDKSVS